MKELRRVCERILKLLPYFKYKIFTAKQVDELSIRDPACAVACFWFGTFEFEIDVDGEVTLDSGRNFYSTQLNWKKTPIQIAQELVDFISSEEDDSNALYYESSLEETEE